LDRPLPTIKRINLTHFMACVDDAKARGVSCGQTVTGAGSRVTLEWRHAISALVRLTDSRYCSSLYRLAKAEIAPKGARLFQSKIRPSLRHGEPEVAVLFIG
jgi:hypothetical protein